MQVAGNKIVNLPRRPMPGHVDPLNVQPVKLSIVRRVGYIYCLPPSPPPVPGPNEFGLNGSGDTVANRTNGTEWKGTSGQESASEDPLNTVI